MLTVTKEKRKEPAPIVSLLCFPARHFIKPLTLNQVACTVKLKALPCVPTAVVFLVMAGLT